MSIVHYHKREICVKIVYYGPALGGKTTSLEFMHRTVKGVRGNLISLTTEEDRTLYFDYLPIELPKLGGFAVRVQLFTVPGQVFYNSTRKLVLEGADGVVFVADSQPGRLAANQESLDNLIENLADRNVTLFGLKEIMGPPKKSGVKIFHTDAEYYPSELPWIIQYNKRDLPDIMPVAELEKHLNIAKVPSFETVATEGQGILKALKVISTQVLTSVRNEGRRREVERVQEATSGAEATAPSAAKRGRPPPEALTMSALADISDIVEHLAPISEESEEDKHKHKTPTSKGLPAIPPEAVEPPREKRRSRDSKITAATVPVQAEAGQRRVGSQVTKQPIGQMAKKTREASAVQPASKARQTSAVASQMNTQISAEVEAAIKAAVSAVGIVDQHPSKTPLPQELPERPVPVFSELISMPHYRHAIALVEDDLQKGDWSGAVKRAGEAFRELSRALAESMGAGQSTDGGTFAALLTAMPASRFLRFRKTEGLLKTSAPVTGSDACFALFFLLDFALSVEEFKRKQYALRASTSVSKVFA